MDIVIKDKTLGNDIVYLTLNHQNIMVYYHGFYILDKATELNPELFYEYWFDFAQLLKSKNTYHRQIGIVIISNMINVDINNNFSNLFDNYLSCLYDEKILIGTYCLKYLKNIYRNKPEYRKQIIKELLGHKKKSSYNVKQEALFEYGILELFDENFDELVNIDEISVFIKERQKSISPKTKKKSKQIIKKYRIKF